MQIFLKYVIDKQPPRSLITIKFVVFIEVSHIQHSPSVYLSDWSQNLLKLIASYSLSEVRAHISKILSVGPMILKP